VKNKQQAVQWQVSFKDCTISDVSLEGCQVATFNRLPRSRRFNLTVVLSEDCSIDVEAWVAWYRTIEDCNIYGLRFAELYESQREKIYNFIHEGGETMEEANFEDRRIFERFSAKLPLKYLSMGLGTEGEAETCDVSAKGVGLLAKKSLPLHTALELWLHIPDKGEPLYARGEVIWSRPAAEGGHRLGINLEKADLMGMSRVLRAI
jgi:hypothetical protein